jgi:ADP-dependent NAD(P)H-hydrate dehydratase
MTPLPDLLAQHALPDATGGKDERGTLVVVGGPATCPGAALLAGTAALRSGAGRVQLVVDPAVSAALGVAIPEALVTGWDQTGRVPDAVAGRLESADAVVIGPGQDRMDPAVVHAIVELAGAAPVVLDAGALPACRTLPDDTVLVVAPNTVEAEELVGPGDAGTLATTLSEKLLRPVAVRGAVTVVADGDERWAFDDAPPGLGTPGSGDVLIGVLGRLLAGGMDPVGALGWAVELHAVAAALLAQSTPVGYLAREIADQLPRALATVRP